MEAMFQILMALGGTMAFSVLFGAAPRHYLRCGLVGAIGWSIYLLVKALVASEMISILIASAFLTALSRWLSVWQKAPTIIFLVTGIFPLVPGAAIFYTAYYLFQGNQALALTYGLAAMKTSIAIALGIGFSYSVPAKYYGWKRNPEIWNEQNHRL